MEKLKLAAKKHYKKIINKKKQKKINLTLNNSKTAL